MSSFLRQSFGTALLAIAGSSVAGAQQLGSAPVPSSANAASASGSESAASVAKAGTTGLETLTGRLPRGVVGTASGSPLGFGAEQGFSFFGGGYQAPIRFSAGGDPAASMTVGYGMGNSDGLGAVEIAASTMSTSALAATPRVGLALKLHKLIAENLGVAVGVQGLAVSGGAGKRPSFYAVASRNFGLEGNEYGMFRSLSVSLGVGSEEFQSASGLNGGKHGVGLFGSLALRVNDVSSLLVDYNGQDMSVGVSFIPFKSLPLVLTPMIADVTGSASNGLTLVPGVTRKTGPRFTLGMVYSFNGLPEMPRRGPAPVIVPPAPQRTIAKGEEDTRQAAPKTTEETAKVSTANEEDRRKAAIAAEESRARNEAALDLVRAALARLVFYDFDKDEIRDDQKAALEAKVPILLANPEMRIRVAGHTDERGSDEYNLALSQRRAASAKRYLVFRGVDAERVETVGLGEEMPADPGHTEEAWAKNRRSEFEVTVGGGSLRVPQ